jgi:hypothetical protein
MTAIELTQDLEKQGIRLEIDGSDLIIDAPEDLLTPETLQALTRRKAEIVEMLKARGSTFAENGIDDSEIAWRIEVMKKQMPAEPPYPFLIAREDIETRKGACYSCGDPLTGGSLYICQSCLRAKVIVLDIAENTLENRVKNAAQTA